MGNCLESWRHCREERGGGEEEEEDVQKQKTVGFEKEGGGFEKNGFRVKILLSREELDWFLQQLKEKDGRKLEDVLVEMERGRDRSIESWKPSLESIMETPEVQTMETNVR
ncbi:hypothetical protein H6P81_014414 [Aristolochia fimbriata]|uniref:Uncharacterized protein n=1 Tax=Aristolochia fimbriata TaxID=158543 RepID=A0AAV7EK86_ARIFI|nr:hypothetical protein H6P81_014414 [Aristolochia fimbriata]